MAITNLPMASWQKVVSSADGTKLAILGYTNAIYTSSDGGVTWKSNSVSGITSWQGIASSADGSKLFAAANNGPIYISTDSGTNWIQDTNVPIENLYGLTSSADGSKLFVTPGESYPFGIYLNVFGGYIYTLYSTPMPQLNIAPSSNNLAFSWIIPSTNFVLQQNLDLTTTNWVMLTNAPTLNLTNLQYQVVLSPTNSSGFFRLVAQ